MPGVMILKETSLNFGNQKRIKNLTSASRRRMNPDQVSCMRNPCARIPFLLATRVDLCAPDRLAIRSLIGGGAACQDKVVSN